jgi:hypothetical protein
MPRPAKQKPPHAFVLEALAPLNPEVRRMFSGFAVYLADRIVCMLRDHHKSPGDNGVWLVLSDSTSPGNPEFLRNSHPSVPSGCLAIRFAIGFSFQATVPPLRRKLSMHVICCCVTIHASAESLNQGGKAPTQTPPRLQLIQSSPCFCRLTPRRS